MHVKTAFSRKINPPAANLQKTHCNSFEMSRKSLCINLFPIKPHYFRTLPDIFARVIVYLKDMLRVDTNSEFIRTIAAKNDQTRPIQRD